MSAIENDRYTIDADGTLVMKPGVSMIRDKEFSGNDKIKKAIIPGTVDSIGVGAFSGCKLLKEVEMKEGVRVIWMEAFSKCKKLTKIQVPSSCEIINNYAFSYCTSLKNIVIPTGTRIEEYAIFGCEALEKVIIKDK